MHFLTASSATRQAEAKEVVAHVRNDIPDGDYVVVGGDFNLVNQDGQPVDQTMLNGKWSLVFFGFTFCPEFCPTTLAELAVVQQRLGDKAKDLQIVFVSIDTFAARHLSLHGYSRETTPRLEELARQAVVFEHCVANASWTLPSYLSVLTGLYPRSHHVALHEGSGAQLGSLDWWQVADNRWTIGEALRARGYATGAFVDTHWLSTQWRASQGFDVYDGTAALLPFEDPGAGIRLLVEDLGKRWLEQRSRDVPSFLFLHALDAHGPYWPEAPFRDAFPAQITLFDRAVQAVAALDEPEDQNPIAARVRADQQALLAQGVEPDLARRRASFRVFGSKPGAYGAGLQALIDERGWESEADLARAYVAWGGYAYGGASEGVAEHRLFKRRLAAVELVLHNQDNREHDILDSDDYYQFEGGIAAAVRHLSGDQPEIYHNDHSRPETPRIRTLKEEIGRIVRARAVNPKWLNGVMRHGYKGAFEMAATVDYLFAFAATADCVADHHFELVFDAYLVDDKVRAFLEENNPAALKEIAQRLLEAQARQLWRPKSNIAHARLSDWANGQPEKEIA